MTYVFTPAVTPQLQVTEPPVAEQGHKVVPLLVNHHERRIWWALVPESWDAIMITRHFNVLWSHIHPAIAAGWEALEEVAGTNLSAQSLINQLKRATGIAGRWRILVTEQTLPDDELLSYVEQGRVPEVMPDAGDFTLDDWRKLVEQRFGARIDHFHFQIRAEAEARTTDSDAEMRSVVAARCLWISGDESHGKGGAMKNPATPVAPASVFKRPRPWRKIR